MPTFPVPSKVPELGTQQDSRRLHCKYAIVSALIMSGGSSVFLIITPVHAHRHVQRLRRHIRRNPRRNAPIRRNIRPRTLQTTPSLTISRTTPNRVFDALSLRETPPTNQPTETVKSRIMSLEILLHAQRQTIMRQGRSTKTVPVYISVFIHQRHAVTGRMLFDPFR